MEYEKLFIGGDLSGIQKYLYNISSKQAAVSLKGRSYYLQQYMENVCERLLHTAKKSGADFTEVIYCSGGKFYLITDFSSKIASAIEETAKEIKTELWKEQFGQLGINISATPFTEHSDGSVDTDGLTNQKPGCLWSAANKVFAKQKNQKYKDIISNEYEKYFNPIAVGGSTKVCAISGVESAECVSINLSAEDEEVYVLPCVKQQIQLGKELRAKQNFKSFEDYAGDSYLGVLRMDVDGLGQRFIKGFDSISQYKMFSKRLVDFFNKRIVELQAEDEFKHYLNIIYSGGDDLFIVGRWDKTIDFADRIRKETAYNFSDDNITISGGVSIVKPKFPIAKAAELAGEAEDAAKEFRNGEKNAFHFLGKTVSWNKEFDYVRSYKNQFMDLIQRYEMRKAILHKLMLYASIADMNKELALKGKPLDYTYVWHLSYYLTRVIERDSSKKVICDFCRSLRDKELFFNNGRNLELVALAARWAELMLKDNINN